MDSKQPKEKVTNLEQALQLIEKQFGKGAIMRLGDGEIQKVEAIPTGCLTLDIALGIGGIPKGRIIEIFGPESSGKTTVALSMVAEAQKAGGMCSFIDAEHALDPVYAQNLGVNLNDLYISQPDSGEQALNIVETLVRSNSMTLIVVDSVAALTPQAEIDGEMGESQVGLQARLMSKALRKLAGICGKSGCSIVFINQLREKVGQTYGNPEVTTGGKALKFYSSVRIDIRKGETIKSGTEAVGNKVKARIVKNKVAPPFRVAEFDILYGKGVSKTGCIMDLAVEKEIIAKNGNWYTYGADKFGPGRDKVLDFLDSHPDDLAAVEEAVRGKIFGEEQ